MLDETTMRDGRMGQVCLAYGIPNACHACQNKWRKTTMMRKRKRKRKRMLRGMVQEECKGILAPAEQGILLPHPIISD